MKKIIIVRNDDDEAVRAFALAFVQNSVSVAVCRKEELFSGFDFGDDVCVLSFGFDDGVSLYCEREGLPCFFWISVFPAPELFLPGLWRQNNRIFITERDTFEIFSKTGHPNVYHPKDASLMSVFSYDEKKAAFLAERMMLRLENDEKKYLQGMLRCQEIFRQQNILFKAMPDELVTRLYSYALLPEEYVLIMKRYVVTECILRPLTEKGAAKTEDPVPGKEIYQYAVKEILKIHALF